MTKKYEPVVIPEHWHENSWDDKAKENPLFAVMTTPNYHDSGTKIEDFTQEELDFFFEKGRRVWHSIVKLHLEHVESGPHDPVIVEYGCGMGRVIKAVREDGYRVSGIDISPTMLEYARNFVPEAEELSALDEKGRSTLKDESADLVFSFAVLKHIHSLESYAAAMNEILRIIKPGGVLVLNVNSQDFIHGSFETPGRTVHFENYSEHYKFDEEKPYRVRKYMTWSGIYISYDWLKEQIEKADFEIVDRFHHTPKKLQGIWVVAKKNK